MATTSSPPSPLSNRLFHMLDLQIASASESNEESFGGPMDRDTSPSGPLGRKDEDDEAQDRVIEEAHETRHSGRGGDPKQGEYRRAIPYANNATVNFHSGPMFSKSHLKGNRREINVPNSPVESITSDSRSPEPDDDIDWRFGRAGRPEDADAEASSGRGAGRRVGRTDFESDVETQDVRAPSDSTELSSGGIVPIKNKGKGDVRGRGFATTSRNRTERPKGTQFDAEMNSSDTEEDSRSPDKEMRSSLLDIARQFERLAQDAIDGRYSDLFFSGSNDHKRKLRTVLQYCNLAFDRTLSKKGMTYKLQTEAAQKTSDENDEDDIAIPQFDHSFLYRYDFPDPKLMREAEMMKHLDKLASRNKGKEFPSSPQNELVIEMFKMQSTSWEEIAFHYVWQVLEVTQQMIHELLADIVRNGPTVNALLRIYVRPFFRTKKKQLSAKVKELLRPYVSNCLLLETTFYQRFQKAKLGNLANQLAEDLAGSAYGESSDTTQHRFQELLTETPIGTKVIMCKAEAYYEMARGIFTENVINLAIETDLICHIPKILTTEKIAVINYANEDVIRDIPKILTTEKVRKMSNDTLGALALLELSGAGKRQHIQFDKHYARAWRKNDKWDDIVT